MGKPGRIPSLPVTQPQRRPLLAGAPPATQGVPRARAPNVEKKRWTFGFRFFKQERYFAFEGLRATWFASLFERLQAMCGICLEEMNDPGLASDMRCHDVKWGDASNFTRGYFSWIPSPYFEAEEEYPLVQFMVSTGLGRVVGFFDEQDVFQIVAFDPQHNIQKSKGRTGRKDCQPIRSDIMELQSRVDRALALLDDPAATQKARAQLTHAATGLVQQGRVWVTIDLDETDAGELHKHVVAAPGRSIGHVVERGILAFLEDAEQTLAQIASETPSSPPRDDDDGEG